VLVAGDVHGNTKWALTLVKLARRYGASGILQVGDFWYWSHSEAGERYLGTLDRALTGAGLWILVSPGNHDNHELLGRQRLHDDGFIWLRDTIAVAPFGARWTWRGTRFGALGGAFSVDWEPDPGHNWPGRVPGVDWWPALEEPTMAGAAKLGDEPLDVLITHDAPNGTDMTGIARPKEGEAAARARAVIDAVVHRLKPQLLLHGHCTTAPATPSPTSTRRPRRRPGSWCGRRRSSKAWAPTSRVTPGPGASSCSERTGPSSLWVATGRRPTWPPARPTSEHGD
jgi:hypothetical protein